MLAVTVDDDDNSVRNLLVGRLTNQPSSIILTANGASIEDASSEELIVGIAAVASRYLVNEMSQPRPDKKLLRHVLFVLSKHLCNRLFPHTNGLRGLGRYLSDFGDALLFNVFQVHFI